MRSNYRPIGDYIRLVDERNSELRVKNLLGLSISKEFIPSVANIIGTDMENYKIIKKGQFACSLMQVRRDKKLPVALLNQFSEAILSPAYPVFEVINPSELLPEYLMMWFSRSEFDREACFYSVGGVRGSLEWDDFCNMKLPVPSPEKQKEIVEEYHIIVNRMDLNQRMIQKLEETAQAIYKQWFVDFEFPISAELAQEMGNPELEGKPYKSNGGEMVESELGEIPKGWEVKPIKSFGNVITGKTPSSDNPEDFGDFLPFVTPGDFSKYSKFAIGAERNLSEGGSKNLKNKILKSGSVIVTCIGSDMGKVVLASSNCITNQQMNSIVPTNSCKSDYLYYNLKSISEELKSIALGGSTMPMLSKTDFEKILILKPLDNALQIFERIVTPINSRLLIHSKLTNSCIKIKNLLLSKIATIESQKLWDSKM